MATSNNSNNSKNSGLNQSELAAFGQTASFALSGALQAAMLAFNAPPTKVTSTDLTQQVSDTLRFRRLNTRPAASDRFGVDGRASRDTAGQSARRTGLGIALRCG